MNIPKERKKERKKEMPSVLEKERQIEKTYIQKGKKKEDKETKRKMKMKKSVGYLCFHINLYMLFNAKSIFIQINNSFSNYSVWHRYTV